MFRKKHTSVDKVKFPRKCDLCEREKNRNCNSNGKNQAKFKCDDFFGESNLTMEVHIVKQHSEKYEGGLFEFEAQNLKSRYSFKYIRGVQMWWM